MRKDNLRTYRQEIKKLIPKKANVTAAGSRGFCKYGRVYGDRLQSQYAMVIPLGRNQNNNWKIG